MDVVSTVRAEPKLFESTRREGGSVFSVAIQCLATATPVPPFRWNVDILVAVGWIPLVEVLFRHFLSGQNQMSFFG